MAAVPTTFVGTAVSIIIVGTAVLTIIVGTTAKNRVKVEDYL